MSKTQLNVLFKKIQKDDKKEVLEFHVQGEKLPNSQEIVQMSGSIVVLEVEKSDAGSFNVEFKSFQKDSKKTTLKFNVKGDSDIVELYPLAGSIVTINLEPTQMSIDEYYDHEEDGIEYKVGKDGIAEVSPDQMTIDDLPVEEDDLPFTDVDPFEDELLD